jgi:hypothetical protein
MDKPRNESSLKNFDLSQVKGIKGPALLLTKKHF